MPLKKVYSTFYYICTYVVHWNYFKKVIIMTLCGRRVGCPGPGHYLVIILANLYYLCLLATLALLVYYGSTCTYFNTTKSTCMIKERRRVLRTFDTAHGTIYWNNIHVWLKCLMTLVIHHSLYYAWVILIGTLLQYYYSQNTSTFSIGMPWVNLDR